ncbi:L,D-transpeptidase [Rubellimicrobium roseum]|uniref:L,D-transpeptidase n=1 Tax=Rubellimicrobium roseum TaxID=687525 RepID=A0A5C4NDM7_9RHOB|nr:L,D-transpeptidase [Rubellimicrobium roseum]TNC67221.1 L,D-transpeptidase [Rubellimicrobium roseum]
MSSHSAALLGLAGLSLVVACAPPEPGETPDPVAFVAPLEPAPPALTPDELAMDGPVQDGDTLIPAVDPQYLTREKIRQEVDYWTAERSGTTNVDPYARTLYFILEGDRAMRYAVAVGDDGRGCSGEGIVPYAREWPRWTPTSNMLAENPELYGPHRNGMPGGPENPLGARALYIHQDGEDTLYRIHGTPQQWSIGEATSAGCIRLFQQNIIDLHQRVEGNTRVVVLSAEESGQGTRSPNALIDPLPMAGGSVMESEEVLAGLSEPDIGGGLELGAW